MILHYARLQRFPTVFKSLTGLRVPLFDDLVAADEALQPYAAK